MTRYEGPVRFRFNGDPELARQYIYVGRNLLGEIREQMERNNLAQLSRTIRNQDGTYVRVYSGFGENHIEIFREEPEAPPEPELGGDFVTVPASEEAPSGWGEPFTDIDGNPINPPLGTIGGAYPQTLLSWVDPNWRARRYPDYKDFWPDGFDYGNNSWAGNTASFGPVALSWKSKQRYRDYGFIFTSKTIYYNGFILCSAKEYVIGAAIVGDNLVVQSATQEALAGRLATWHCRPFKPGGYDNDDDYDLITNPDGWRECDGDFQENFAREDARQPTVFSPDGSKAAGCYVVDRVNYQENKIFVNDINVVSYSFSAFGDQVSVVRTRELNTYDAFYATYISNFSHKYIQGNVGEPNIEIDTSDTNAGPFYAPVYSEYDPEGNLVECGMVGGNARLYEYDENPTLVQGKLIDENNNQSSFQFGINTLQGYILNSRREEFDGVPVGSNFFNLTQKAIIDGNLSLGYFMVHERYESPRNVWRTRILLIGPNIGTIELINTTNLLSYPFFAPGISVYNPAHSYFEPDFNDSFTFSLKFQSQDLSQAVGFPESGVDSGFEHYFAAHRNAEGQIIVTAWARWDRGTEVLFGGYDFITDGNLPALTKVQGTNQRHKNTGVI